jgi:transposase-like protein
MCPYCQSATSKPRKKGFFAKRASQAGRVQRYYCRDCRKSFSDQTNTRTYRERKPYVDQPLFRLLVAGVSQAKCAEIFDLHPVTVARKLVRFGPIARHQNTKMLKHLALAQRQVVVFDEMETFEHSKCKPLSITVAVQEHSRLILASEVASMPAKGRLAEISRRKYGRRRDDRPKKIRQALTRVKELMPEIRTIKSDQCPRYPKYVKEIFPSVKHEAFKGRRGCTVGQGELKAGGFDPLFSLNHSCAMYRDNIKRLSRRTWCTTKRPDRLQHLIDLYAFAHNAKILDPKRRAVLMSDPIK